MVKAFELRTQTKAQLAEQLKDLKHELLTLRTQKVKEANKPQLAKMYYRLTQWLRAQEHRPRADRHEPDPARQPARLVQGQEVHAAGSQIKEDEGY